MNITEAIKYLENMKLQHGDVEVYFDCPYCMKSTKPDRVVAVARLEKEKKEI